MKALFGLGNCPQKKLGKDQELVNRGKSLPRVSRKHGYQAFGIGKDIAPKTTVYRKDSSETQSASHRDVEQMGSAD